MSAYYLDSIVKKDTVVGISWGNTLYHIVKYIDANNKKNIPITVVPIMGASNVKRPERDAMDRQKIGIGIWRNLPLYLCPFVCTQ